MGVEKLPANPITDTSIDQKARANPLSANEACQVYVTLPDEQVAAGLATTTLAPEKSLQEKASPEKSYRRVSGSLVEAVALGVAENTATYCTSRLAKQLIPAMILIPIWLIIILLSPLDAYATAKLLTKQVN
jgi:hypothetical protein